MKQLAVIFILLIIAGCMGTSFVLSLAADQAIVAVADVAMQPKSAADLIIESRTTAPERRTGALWFGAGLLALCLVIFGVVFIVMKGGTDFLKQLRLFRKKQTAQQRPFIPSASPQPFNELPVMPAVPRTPILPAWSEADERQTNSS